MNEELLKGILYILIVAIVMSIFELCFFVFFLVPIEKKAIQKYLENSKGLDTFSLFMNAPNNLKAVTL